MPLAELRIEKLAGSLPATLTANTIYYIRTGAGFVQYVTNSGGTLVAYAATAIDVPVALSPTTGSVVIDLSDRNTGTLDLTGNPTFTTLAAARISGLGRVIRINPGTAARTPTFPAWKWLTPIPTTFAANKMGLLTLQVIGGSPSAETDVFASYVPQI